LDEQEGAFPSTWITWERAGRPAVIDGLRFTAIIATIVRAKLFFETPNSAIYRITSTDISTAQTAALFRAAKTRSSTPVTTGDTAISVSTIVASDLELLCILQRLAANKRCRYLLQNWLQ
jgi:hypothetical protein